MGGFETAPPRRRSRTSRHRDADGKRVRAGEGGHGQGDEEAEAGRILLIMVYRFYLRRQLARAARTRQKCRYYLYHRCASIVESAARGRLEEDEQGPSRTLRYIKNRHPISLKKALAQKFEIDKRTGESKSLKRSSGTTRKCSSTVVYRDYFILCQRTGFVPPRIIVEQNIEEIARRIRVREEYLITLIQALYRGIILRKCLEIYKYEIIR